MQGQGSVLHQLDREAERVSLAGNELRLVMVAMEQRKKVVMELMDTEERYLQEIRQLCRLVSMSTFLILPVYFIKIGTRRWS